MSSSLLRHQTCSEGVEGWRASKVLFEQKKQSFYVCCLCKLRNLLKQVNFEHLLFSSNLPSHRCRNSFVRQVVKTQKDSVLGGLIRPPTLIPPLDPPLRSCNPLNLKGGLACNFSLQYYLRITH